MLLHIWKMDKAEKSESMAADFEGSHFPTLYVSHANNVGRGEGVGAVRNFCNITYDHFFESTRPKHTIPKVHFLSKNSIIKVTFLL